MKVTTNPDGTRLLEPNSDEREALDWMESAFSSRKFERFLEDYLKTRHKNMQVHEDREILAALTPEEKQTFKARIKKDK